MKFTHRILMLPIFAALGFVILATITWRGNEESRRLSEQMEERFFADLELSLRLQNVALRTRQAFLTAVNVDEELGVIDAEEQANAFRDLIEDGLARPQLDPDELKSLRQLFDGYYQLAIPAVHTLANKDIADITDDELAAIGQMNLHYEDLNAALARRTERSQAEMDAALEVSRSRQKARQRVAFLASTIGLVLLLAASTAVIASILRPLRNIMRGTESIAAGDLYERIDYESGDMLGRLANSFRKMQRSLIRDVNHRKRAEGALRASEERLAFAFDAADDGLWDVDLAENDVYLSPRYFTILGYPSSESVRGVPSLFELCRPEERERVRAEWKSHAEDGEPFELAMELRRRDGDWCWVRARGKIVEEDTNGKPLRSVGTIADITQQREAERKLREAAAGSEVSEADGKSSVGAGARAADSSGLGAAGAGTAGGGRYGADAVLSDLGRPISLLLAHAQEDFGRGGEASVGADTDAEESEARKPVASRGETTLGFAEARGRVADALGAAARVVALDREPQSTCGLRDLVLIVAALEGVALELDRLEGDPAAFEALRFSAEAVQMLREAVASGDSGHSSVRVLAGEALVEFSWGTDGAAGTAPTGLPERPGILYCALRVRR